MADANREIAKRLLQYRQHFDAEMQNGSLSSRAGVNYKIEK